MSTVVVAVLGTWLILTGVFALPLKGLRAPSELLSKIVPTWSFFAPNPGSHDFRLLYRDELVDGTITAWREVSVCPDQRPVTAALWNPGQRKKKALFDIAQELSAGASGLKDPELIKLSVPYLLLVTYVSGLSPSVLSLRRQFSLVATSRRDEPTVLFVSAMHDLEEEQTLVLSEPESAL